MEPVEPDFWEWVQRISAVIALVALPYLVVERRRTVPKFSYQFSGQSGNGYKKDDHWYYKMIFTGIIKNHSLSPNTVSTIYLVVWKDKSKTSTLRMGMGHYKITTEDGEKVKQPIRFEPREAKKLHIEEDIYVEGTPDERILTEYEELSPGSRMYLPKHRYELAFEDSDGNMFSQQGKLLSKELIDLNWTLENTFKDLKEGNYKPFINHKLKLFRAKWRLRRKRLQLFLGFTL